MTTSNDNENRKPLFRADYRPTPYKIPETKLHINVIDEKNTLVTNRFKVTRNPDPAMKDVGGPLVLDSEEITLKGVKIIENGVERELDASEYTFDAEHLTITNPPNGPFEMEIVTHVNPDANTKLSGIYMAGPVLGSQCEAQGFRRITPFYDRPDNLAVFDVTIEADKAKYPILLSNGNGDPYTTTDLGNGRHQSDWKDPWPKPSYLFAIIGGDLKVMEDTFTTMSGKKVDLRIFVQPGYEDKIAWAMQSIKRSMKWDEERYGREYDLDCFHVAVLDKFNAGAMENKGLNVYNVSLLVGDPNSSTDAELTRIEGVIAHEYFHNWTGDRVTVRDWFELTLKEGLTVLRDRQFTEDMHSKSIKQIEDAILIRSLQFQEDAGSNAHPIRPEKVEVFDNIYTLTIYRKGSFVLGMMKTMMGEDTWRAAMDEYFDRFDGQAVTCDDFIDVMQEVSGIDLTQFRRWYSQSGTPELAYSGVYDPKAKTYTLTLEQNNKPTADQATKQDMHFPVAVGLIDKKTGKDIALKVAGDSAEATPTKVLHLKEKKQTFVFENVEGPVVPSILREFSAPVKIVTEAPDDELIFRMAHDSDGYNRYEAGESLKLKVIRGLIKDAMAGKKLALSASFVEAYRTNINTALQGDMSFNAFMLGTPAYDIITQGLDVIDPDSIDAALKFLKKEIASTFKKELKTIYAATATPANEVYDVVPAQVGRRSLHNTALAYLSSLEKPAISKKAYAQFTQSTNMTERIGALNTLSKGTQADLASKALNEFYTAYKSNPNIIDNWLRLCAGRPGDAPVDAVTQLMQHEAFDITNPNKVRAVAYGFAFGNIPAFHNKDGSGYKFFADFIIQLNEINPRTAARMATEFSQFKRYDEQRQALMVGELERIMATPKLDASIKEIVGKALDTVEKCKSESSKKFGASAEKKPA